DWVFKKSNSQEELILDFAYCFDILREFVNVMEGKKFSGSSLEDAKFNIHKKRIKITSQDSVKDICEKVMMKIMDIDNEKDALETVRLMIEWYMKNRHDDVSVFALSATYRPMKQNISVKEFVNCMEKRGIKIEP
ncbi:5798_t:CDS:2, partial [Acaulospora morrowiae]